MADVETVHGSPVLEYCYGVEDGLDGYAVHTKECRSYGNSWSGPNSDCIKFNSTKHKSTRFVCTCGQPGLGCYCRG